MPRILNARLKGQRGENVDCYAYTYLLMKEAGICTTCKYRFADVRNLCRRCYEYQHDYMVNYRINQKMKGAKQNAK